jgi:hypothetical protein
MVRDDPVGIDHRFEPPAVVGKREFLAMGSYDVVKATGSPVAMADGAVRTGHGADQYAHSLNQFSANIERMEYPLIQPTVHSCKVLAGGIPNRHWEDLFASSHWSQYQNPAEASRSYLAPDDAEVYRAAANTDGKRRSDIDPHELLIGRITEQYAIRAPGVRDHVVRCEDGVFHESNVSRIRSNYVTRLPLLR